MSNVLLDRVIECQGALLRSLDARDVAAIESASEALSAAVNAAKAVDVWQRPQETRSKLEYGLKQTAAARIRVNFLADWTCQKIEKLASLRGLPREGLYKKPLNTGLLRD